MAKPCVQIVIDEALAQGIKLSDARAKGILKTINNFATELAKVKHGGIFEDGVTEAARRYIGELKYAQEKAIRAEILDIRGKRKIIRMAERFKKEGYTLGEGREAILNGSGKKVVGVGMHMDRLATFRWTKALGRYEGLLSKRLISIDARGDIEDKVAHELWDMSQPSPKPGGVTGSKDAYDIAKARMEIHTYMDSILHSSGDLNRKRAGWAFPQSWSQDRLMGIAKDATGKQDSDVGFKAWRAIVEPRLDPLETYRGESPDIWLRSFWDNIYTHEFASGSKSKAKDGGDLGMLSRGRKMVFKDSTSALEVNKLFGEHSSREAFLTYIKKAAEHSARLEVLGANPEKVWNAASAALLELAKKGKDAEKQAASIKSESQRIAFMIASGQTDMPGNVKWAKRLATGQGFVVLATQGATILSAVPGDTLTAHMQMTRFGFSAMDGFARAAIELFGPNNAGTQGFLKHLGIGLEGMAGLNRTRTAPHEAVGRGVGTAIDYLFKGNGVTWWTRGARRGVAGSYLSQLGDAASKSFVELSPRTRALLDKYDIGPDIWEALRHTTGEVGDLGTIMTGSFTKDLPADVLKTLKDRFGAKYDQVVEERLGMLIHGETHNAIIEAGAKERKWSTLGTRAGTYSGIAVRMAMFMKTFPIAMVTKQLSEEIAHGSKIRFLEYTAASMVLGYMSMLVRDTLAGKTPRPFTDQNGDLQLATIKDSLQRGGMYGIWGDMLLQQYDKGFRDFSTYMAGPLAQKVIDPTMSGLNKAVRGDFPGGELNDLAGLIPFNNLIWSKFAIDHTLGYKLKEYADPGVLQKMRANLKRNTNQEYYDWAGPSH